VLASTETIGLFINQTRVDFGKGSFTSITTPGGKALKFLASVRLFITAGKSKIYDDGIHTKIRVWKNKTSANQRGLSEYEIRPMIGIMRDEELLTVAKEKELITERAGIFTLKNGEEGKKVKGRAKMMELLKDERIQKWIVSKGE
jgi:recombination protein RecA